MRKKNFIRAGLILQLRQLAASAAARLCNNLDGPSAIGYGGARGGGKTHWLLSQMGAGRDACLREVLWQIAHGYELRS